MPRPPRATAGPLRAAPKAAAPKHAVIAPTQQLQAAAATIRPAASTVREVRVGIVSHYFSHLSVAALLMETDTLRIGDTIHVKGHTTDFTQRVDTLQVEHEPVPEVHAGQDFGVKVIDHAREHDVVYKVVGR